MLQIDAKLDCLKKKLLEFCKVDYLAVILPVAKAYLWVSMVLISLTEVLKHGFHNLLFACLYILSTG